MLDIKLESDNVVALTGRFDAASSEQAQKAFDQIDGSFTIDFTGLEYISSAGLGVLLATLKRLSDAGLTLVLRNMSQHVRDVFRYSGLDKVFTIQ